MKSGFTLIELIIVIAISIFLVAIFFPIGLNFYQIQVLNGGTDSIVWLLKQAQSSAISQKNDSAFGLYLAQNQAILFQGNNYQGREASQDINVAIPLSVRIAGLQEIDFAKKTGLPAQTGSIFLSLAGRSEEIQINSIGLISY